MSCDRYIDCDVTGAEVSDATEDEFTAGAQLLRHTVRSFERSGYFAGLARASAARARHDCRSQELSLPRLDELSKLRCSPSLDRPGSELLG